MPAGFFSFGGCWQQSRASAKQENGQEGKRGGFVLPIATLLARIRKLIPGRHDDHYDEIARGFGNGALRVPPTPMSDHELARAIAEFLKEAPSVDSVGTLGRRLDPSTPL